MVESTDAILADQIAYYRARALEYDQWFLRQGRYDRGPAHRAEWLREVERVRTDLLPQIPNGAVLELACGTGLWTQFLAQRAERVVAVDASPEVIAINAARLQAPNVDYVTADIFAWSTDDRFDAIFFSFWLSHVPTSCFDDFWGALRTRLNPDGRVLFVDSLLEQDSTAKDHGTLDRSGVMRRRLNDGREFEIVKVFYEPADLQRRLRGLGWHANVSSSGRFFLFGTAHVDESAADLAGV